MNSPHYIYYFSSSW